MSKILTPDSLAEDSVAKLLAAQYVRLTGEQMLVALDQMQPEDIVMTRDGKSVTAASFRDAINANPLSTFYYVPRQGA